MDSGRGGKREGSGRKPVGEAPGVMKSFRLPPEVIETLKTKADAAGIPQSQALARAIEAWSPGPGL